MKKLFCLITFISFICCTSDSPQEVVPPTLNYTLTIKSEEGGSVSSTGGSYESGKVVTITATANPEYVFSGWSNGSTDNPLSVTMNSNQTITASFDKVTYTLSTSTDGEGEIKETLVSSGRSTDYNSGSVVRLTAVPSNGWIFIGWTGDYVGEDNPIDVDVSESKSFNASFVISYQLSAESSEGGSVSTSGGSYAEGTQVSITATPNDGYEFIGWTGSEETSLEINILLNSNIKLIANFQPIPLEKCLIGNNYDYDCDGRVNSEDYRPKDPSQTDDVWGKIVETKPEIFFASDISQKIRDGFMSDLNLITSELGNYGPLEWWIIGRDINAANELAEIYCRRRVDREQQTFSPNFYYESCIANMMYPNHNVGDQHVPSWWGSDYVGRFENYRAIEPPSSNAGLNGMRDWGIHLLSSSLPYHYDDNEWGNPKEDYSATVFHEYIHVVQSANLYTTQSFVDEVNNTRRVGWGPTSMAEGAASYINEFLLLTYIKDGKYDESPSSNRELRNVMRTKMFHVQEMLKNCPNFKLQDLNYGNICSPYHFGAWAVAYLLNKIDNQYAMQELFWPSINTLGYYPAFESIFGLTFDEFNDEYHEFLKLPIDEQLLIIPDL